jgi:YesN/AraC family two-component response regulator
VACFAGLISTSVPIMIGKRLLGFLQTGQSFPREPSKARFNKVASKIINWGVNTDLRKLEDAYFHASVISSRQYRAMIRMLEIFANHLDLIANQVVLEGPAEESSIVRRAKLYIEKHSGEKIQLSTVSRALNVSAYYFCRVFKSMSGMTFIEYLNRARIERAKMLLLNKHLRVKEIGFKVGFQSLTTFHRVFREVAGQSPTEYRRNHPVA